MAQHFEYSLDNPDATGADYPDLDNQDQALDDSSSSSSSSDNSKTNEAGYAPLGHEQDELAELLRKDRLNFIRKVLGILCVQLAITAVFCVGVMNSSPMQTWMVENLWLFYVMLILPFGIIITLTCFNNIAKKVPYNYLLLFSFTLC